MFHRNSYKTQTQSYALRNSQQLPVASSQEKDDTRFAVLRVSLPHFQIHEDEQLESLKHL